VLKYLFCILPEFAFSYSLYLVNENNDKLDCTTAQKAYDTGDITYCKQNPLSWDVAGMGVWFMFWESFVYYGLVMLFESCQQGCEACYHRRAANQQDEPYEIDDDLLAEAKRVEEGKAAQDMVLVEDLRKVYPGRGNVGPKVAVKSLTFGVPSGEVFGFLGINGAGKTTCLSILSGEIPATSGHAALAGLDMHSQRQAINQLMGYCPQFDALLSHLTGREHLEMYCRIKGLREDTIPLVVEDTIDKMDLREHCDREAGGYSGGNKRKLSVAIALVGNPKIVFLDEPSTGMDPEARRFMWDVIASTMHGRSVILTTHSMEEAEALSNRIGIMVGGRLRCLGTGQHLKSRFGAGYTLEVRIPIHRTADARAFVESTFPGSVCAEQHGGQLRYDIPRSTLQLGEMFDKMEGARSTLEIQDYALSQTTLEKIFLKFAAEQEEEIGGAPGLAAAPPPPPATEPVPNMQMGDEAILSSPRVLAL